MSWRQPTQLFSPNMSDREMMEEVLELLAGDSTDQARSASTNASTTSSNVTDSNHSSTVAELYRSSISGSNHDHESGDNGMQGSIDVGSAEDVGDQHSLHKKSSSSGHSAVQEQAALGPTQHMQHSMASYLLPLVEAPSRRPLAPWSPPLTHPPDPPFFGRAPDRKVSAATAAVPPSAMMPQLAAPMAILTPIAPPIPHETTLPQKKRRASPSRSTSQVLSTGQRVNVLNPAEFEELRRKLRMQTASRRYRKRKKEESRRQKVQILELQTELARLRDLEGQTKQYQQRSIESLEEELKIHHDEIADLSEKLQDAAKEEVDWINLMSAHIRNYDTSSSLGSVINQDESGVDNVGDPGVASLETSRENRREHIQEQEEKQREEEDLMYAPLLSILELWNSVSLTNRNFLQHHPLICETLCNYAIHCSPNAIAAEASSPSMTPGSTRTNTSSDTFPTEQHVHVLTDGELVDLSHRLGVHTASISHDKHEKEAARQQELEIQQLRAELSRLKQVEAQLKLYEQRSIESLKHELEVHQQEIASLARKLENAAKDELDWVSQTATRFLSCTDN
ncbi:Hypothetical protein PHPALM_6796 [Phytophthora palmivora]|uniref:BZIP domain-containing protein n=1 Tax=Phytophthora palmivora TaxID=4796 RepID=A0A2P4YDV7_9STRA|nr:Hypothetical protein PHPALM_6796 [Phytophthora palmivora]